MAYGAAEVAAAGFIWIALHLGISSTRLRGLLVNTIGTPWYLAVYSLMAATALGYFISVYTHVPRMVYLWHPNPELYWVPKIGMVFALILLLGGFFVRNPSMVGARLRAEEALGLATGVTRITRHPGQWAIIIWALGHIVVNGDLVSIVFFSSFAILSFIGSFLIDKKKAQAFGDAWLTYTSVTSNVPFLAVMRGQTRLKLSELRLPVVIGLVAYALLWYLHESYTGTVVF